MAPIPIPEGSNYTDDGTALGSAPKFDPISGELITYQCSVERSSGKILRALGVTPYPTLNFKNHTKNMKTKVNSRNNILKALKNSSPPTKLLANQVAALLFP